MLRIDMRKAKPGMVLALPLHNPRAPSRNLLRVGYELTDNIIDKLVETGIKSAWVRYPSLAFLEKFLDLETVKAQQQVVSSITETFESLQTQASAKLDYDNYTKSITQLVEHVIGHPQSAVFLGDLSDSPDDLMRHSSTVAYLSVLMGLKLEGYIVKQRKHVNPVRAKEVANLGLGAMLHDVGITQLPPEVLQRHRDTGNDNDQAWQEHPSLGFRMVRGNVEPSAATVVLNHHQRCDGSGYIGKDFPVLHDTSIHVFARIAGLAEQFDRMRNPAKLPVQPTVWVLNALLSNEMRYKFDPLVLQTLLDVVPPYPPGSIVRLSDGRYAVCIDHSAENPCRPQVQIIPDPKALEDGDLPPGPTVDLGTQSQRLYVAQAEGRDVSELNFACPHLDTSISQAAGW